MRKYGEYFADVRHLEKIDIYRILDLFPTKDHALGHVGKKLILGGVRTGGKTVYDEVVECRDSLNRWLEMKEEDKLKGRVKIVLIEDEEHESITHEIDHVQHCEYTLEQVIGDATLSDWAEWVAVDEDGLVCEFDAEPVRGDHLLKGIFEPDGRQYNEINHVAPPKNWEICLFKVENANKTIQT